jgi:hypothetical protein
MSVPPTSASDIQPALSPGPSGRGVGVGVKQDGSRVGAGAGSASGAVTTADMVTQLAALGRIAVARDSGGPMSSHGGGDAVVGTAMPSVPRTTDDMHAMLLALGDESGVSEAPHEDSSVPVPETVADMAAALASLASRTGGEGEGGGVSEGDGGGGNGSASMEESKSAGDDAVPVSEPAHSQTRAPDLTAAEMAARLAALGRSETIGAVDSAPPAASTASEMAAALAALATQTAVKDTPSDSRTKEPSPSTVGDMVASLAALQGGAGFAVQSSARPVSADPPSVETVVDMEAALAALGGGGADSGVVNGGDGVGTSMELGPIVSGDGSGMGAAEMQAALAALGSRA